MDNHTQINNKEANLGIVILGLGSELYAVEVKNVREVIKIQEISPLPKMPSFIEGVINLRGRIIGIVDLRRYFDVKFTAHNSQTRIMIVRLRNILAGLIVDSVSEVISIPLTAIEKTPEIVSAQVSNNFISGVAKISVKGDRLPGRRSTSSRNDKMVFILNLDAVLSEEEIKHLIEARSRQVKE